MQTIKDILSKFAQIDFKKYSWTCQLEQVLMYYMLFQVPYMEQ